ncbi:MAG: DNA cytosine methyltransferase [Myxococcales bacterium]
MEAAGFVNAVAVELEPVALRTLEAPANRHRWGAILGEDVHSLLEPDRRRDRRSARKILAAAGLREGEADLLVGGPPCQPFSKSGYWAKGDAKRLRDPRARTLEAYLDVLEDALPAVFLLENVPGLAFDAKDEGIRYLEDRIAEINWRKKVHYSFCAAQLNAAEHGVPQLRERVFVVGHREGKQLAFPSPRFALPPPVDMAAGAPALDHCRAPKGLRAAATAWDAIGHLEDDPDPRLLPRGKWAPVLGTIPEGANYLWHTSRGGGLELWGWRTRYWSMLLKLAKNRPSWTLTAQPGPAIGPFHWKSRRLSAQELARLQTFPADYEIQGDVREAHLQLGNAVPSALAEVLGRAIRAQALRRRGRRSAPHLGAETPAADPASGATEGCRRPAPGDPGARLEESRPPGHRIGPGGSALGLTGR